jgi:hypothetical protein
MAESFASARLKLDRAKQHIANLQREFDVFVAENPHALSFKVDPDTSSLLVQLRFKVDIPKSFALILGDAIHNLRCAMDHATWDLIGIDHGTQDRWTKFPTGRTRQDYEATCKGMKTPRDDTKKFFAALEVYKGGMGNLLWGINELDSADKHTVPLH